MEGRLVVEVIYPFILFILPPFMCDARCNVCVMCVDVSFRSLLFSMYLLFLFELNVLFLFSRKKM